MTRVFTVALTGLAAAVFLFSGTLQAENPIKIGMIDTYTGPPSVYCNDVRDGFKLALDEINAKGGVLGRQVVFITRDDKFKVDLGLSAAKELIMREQVDILAGTTNSAVSLAVSDLAKKEKIPLVVTFGKSAAITGSKGHRYVFSMNENTAMIGRAAALTLVKRPYVKYWIAGDDYEFGHAMAQEIWSNLKKLKPEVQLLGESWWKIGEPDFTPYITSILSAKPDAVIVAAGGASCVPFLKAAKTTGFNERVPFLVHMATELSTLKPLGMNAPEGVLGTSPYFFYYPQVPANKVFADNYKQVFGRYPTAGAFCGYVAGHFIAQAFAKAGAVDREKFVDALAGLTIDSPVGKVTVRDFDHQIMLPMFVGVTKADPAYDFLIAGQIETIPADQVMMSVDDVKKAREQ
ncbi:MAG: ABC transporter substrate-binding protein [Desulfomonile tiedjei]|nr:ABC transporter substrate-binding protein [Desulfomonile tiedjei]